MEVLHDLLGYPNRKIYEDTRWFSFSLDSVLLSHFVSVSLSAKRILDLGTGTAPIPLILSMRTKAQIYGVEIQRDVSLLAQKSVAYNQLERQITIFSQDMKEFSNQTESDFFDVITVNPPYFKRQDCSYLNLEEHKQIARHEMKITLEEIFPILRKLLKNGGNFAMIHRTERLMDILLLCRQYGLEPKRLQLVYPKPGANSNMVLVEGVKNGKPGLKILEPFYVHKPDGSYTNRYQSMMKEVTNEKSKEL